MGFVRIFLAASIFFFPTFTNAQSSIQEGPLGLTWGTSVTDLQSRGVELKDFPSSDFGKSFIASKIEKSLADQNATLLSFGFNDKLWRITINGRPYSDDPTGSAAISRYGELSSVLAEKYGKPKEFHRVGDSIYAQPQYFVAGINAGKSNWYSNIDTPNLFIQLAITASDSSTASWRLIYENKLLRKDFDVSKRLKEKGSL